MGDRKRIFEDLIIVKVALGLLQLSEVNLVFLIAANVMAKLGSRGAI